MVVVIYPLEECVHWFLERYGQWAWSVQWAVLQWAQTPEPSRMLRVTLCGASPLVLMTTCQ